MTNIFDEGQVLLIDKPFGWTSFDAVNKIRRLSKAKKVGHAGTLDPLATGLLILCTGKLTKHISGFMGLEKEYRGSLILGATTPTYDLESEPEHHKDAGSVTMEMLDRAIALFRGEIWQVPPAHSAVKKEGKRGYILAREGKEVKLDPRKILIKEFDIIRRENIGVDFRVVCSTGTYIRSLANDVGAALGCGAYLASLRRTRIGEFTVEDAFSMAAAEAFIATSLKPQAPS